MAMDNEELQNVCNLFDSYFIAEKQNQLNKEYKAVSDNIVTDGDCDHRINGDGYVIISNVNKVTNYLIFIDQNGDLFLAVYKYTPNAKFKDITDAGLKIRESTGIKKHAVLADSASSISSFVKSADITQSELLVDINNFKCPECKKSMIFGKVPESETIVAYCKSCQIEYAMVPSKYYIIKARKQLYTSPDERNPELFTDKKKNAKGSKNNGK